MQGLTEFLPVSSSGHLILVHAAFDQAKDWDQRLILDVAVHAGTLLSVLVYFRRDVLKMALGLLSWAKGDFKSEGAALNIYVLLASIPVILAGFALNAIKPSWLLLVEIMAWSTLIFGIVLWIADKKGTQDKSLKDINLKDALIIGLAQTLALIPGTSRSGITMTAGRFLGYSRTESAHFSLLLAIIAIAGAGTLAGIELIQSGSVDLGLDALIAAAVSFITAWLSIAIMMKWLEKSSFTPFAIYRIILGIVLLAGLYGDLWSN